MSPSRTYRPLGANSTDQMDLLPSKSNVLRIVSGEVPQPGRFIDRTGENHLRVARERHCRDRIPMTRQYDIRSAGGP